MKTLKEVLDMSKGKRKIFDMGRLNHSHDYESIIPLENIDMTKVEIKTPNPNFVFECQFDAIDVESFRRAWESYNAGIVEGRSPIAIAAEEIEKEVLKVKIPHGKNLYSRKLRIRR